MVDEYTRHLERERGIKGKGLSQFRIKMIAAVLTVFGPLAYAVLPKFVGVPSKENMFALSIVVISEAISWAAIPMYAWLLYTGFEYTNNTFLYGLRLVILALVCEVPYDYVVFGQPFNMGSQNPVFGLVIALIVLSILDLMYAMRNITLKVVLSVFVIAIGVLWDVLFTIGQSQRIMNIGVVTLGMCLIYYYLHKRENTMIFTAAIFGAAWMLTPGLGVVALHSRNEKLGYMHSWTRWVFYAVYPLTLVICAAIGMA